MNIVQRIALILVAIASLQGIPASATTLIRMGLEELTLSNQMVIIGHVLSKDSYWNSNRSAILTRVQVSVIIGLKGTDDSQLLDIIIEGGQVDDLTSVVVAAAEFKRGNNYLLFLSRTDLPGAAQVLSVRDHAQGVFDIIFDEDDPVKARAVSEAGRVGLFPDENGITLAPGGKDGLPLHSVVQSIRQILEK